MKSFNLARLDFDYLQSNFLSQCTQQIGSIFRVALAWQSIFLTRRAENQRGPSITALCKLFTYESINSQILVLNSKIYKNLNILLTVVNICSN